MAKTAASVASVRTVTLVISPMDRAPANRATTVNTVNTHALRIVMVSTATARASVLLLIRYRVTGLLERVVAQMDTQESSARVFAPRDLSVTAASEIASARTVLCAIT